MKKVIAILIIIAEVLLLLFLMNFAMKNMQDQSVEKQEQIAEVEQIIEEVQKQTVEVPQAKERKPDGYKYTVFTIILRSDGYNVEMKFDVEYNEIEVEKVANAMQTVVDIMRRQATGETEL